MQLLKKFMIGLLLATALTPLIVLMESAHGYVFPKAIYFRSLIEASLLVALYYTAWNLIKKPAESLRTLSDRLRLMAANPLVISLALFFISLIVSTFFAVDRYWAFWGPIDRAEGLWGMLHLLCFFILVCIFFERRHWILFFKFSLGVGVAVAIRAFLEYFGLFGFPESSRPNSFAGNPSYVAIQMLFLLGFSAFVFYESNKIVESHWKQLAWRFGLPLLGALFFATLLLTKTRGALLGLIFGIIAIIFYFAFLKNTESEPEVGKKNDDGKINNQANLKIFSSKRISRLLLILVIIFGAAFTATRDASIWNSVPGLDRLAKTSTQDGADSTTQVRLRVWQISLEAFKERPFFGWGPENYIIAFERHYDPDIANYGEFWFDRAHNKLFDVIVMQGGFGLLTYLALFGVTIFYILKIKQGPKAALLGIVAAYFIYNQFLFDDLISYLYFFALIGYIYHLRKKNPKSEQSILKENTANTSSYSYRIGGLALAASSIFLSISLTASLYYFNYVPFIQATHYQSATSSSSVDAIVETLSNAMKPYNFAQTGIRTQAIDDVFLHQFFYNDSYRIEPKYAPLGNILMKGMQDIIDRHPGYDARYYTRMIEMFNGLAQSDPSFYAKAEPFIRRALEVSPSHHELHYHLAFNLAGQNRIDEAVKAAQYTVNLSPDVVVAHLRLAFMYALAGDSANSQKEIVRMKELDPSLKRLSENDWKTLRFLYAKWGITE